MIESLLEKIFFLAGFAIIAVAANHIARLFPKLKLPLITGLLVMGIISGPFVLNLISHESVKNLRFVSQLALAFIAFAAGAELHLKELRSRFKSIQWMTSSHIVITFLLGTAVVFFVADFIPFIATFGFWGRLMISMLAATIFIVPSPPAVIAVVNEIRASGPFTQTLLGVTILKEFLVVIIFSIIFSVTAAVIDKTALDLTMMLLLGCELLIAFLLGFFLGKFLAFLLARNYSTSVKSILVVLLGYGVFAFTELVSAFIKQRTGFDLHFEPLLVCIIGSFMVTNYSSHRREFLKIINDAGPAVYAVFFTLIGASLALNVMADFALIAVLLVVARIVILIVSSIIGSSISGDPWKHSWVSWMPHIPQAGIGIGLASLVGSQFPGWGEDFSTLMFATIIISLVIGPPLLKWSIQHVGEAHEKGSFHENDGTRDVIIFGLESQSLALAQQLENHGWNVKIATRRKNLTDEESSGTNILIIDDLDHKALEKLKVEKAEAIVAMNSDEENFKICEMIYEKYGTKVMVVRLQDREYFDQFHKLGCLIVEPSTAIVSLLDHFVRSPQAASLLLGMQADQDTIDVEVLNPDIHGLALRDLRLPHDILILSNKRAGQMLISTGYTRLRLHDVLTVVGSIKSLELVKLKIEGY